MLIKRQTLSQLRDGIELARTGRPRKYQEGLAERVTVSVDPALRRRLRENGIELHEALTQGAEMLLDPQLIELRAQGHIQMAGHLEKLKREHIEAIEIQHTLERAQPLIVAFLQRHGRELGPDFWKTGSPHFNKFQRTLEEWQSDPTVAVSLREVSVPQEGLWKLVTLHLAK